MTHALVGRDAENGIVGDLLDAADGESAALIIEGEPGIGKTTLWLDGLRRARATGLQVLTARASAAESVLGYASLADLLAEVDHAVWADLPAPQRQGLDAAVLSDFQTGGSAVDQRAVGSAFLAVLTRLAVAAPLVVAIDDLQWIDGSSAAAIAFAARRLTRRVVWLCTARSDAASSTPELWQPGNPDAVRRLRLSPLTVSELHDVLVAQLGMPVARPTMLRIHHVSGGNPFYALELARELDQGSATDLKLPASLAELARIRIDRVDGFAEEALLAVASLAAPTLRLVASAIGVSPQELLEQLSGAEVDGVIAIDGEHIRFTHPLLAHAVHSGATAPRRRSMHRRLAEVVTEPELRARHLAIADPAGEPETLAALDAGADIARTRGAPAAVAELLELAIERGGGTLERRMTLAQCLFDSGDARRARAVLQQATIDLPTGASRAQALQFLALVQLHTDSFVDAAESGRQALACCPDDEAALRVNILTGLAFSEVNGGAAAAAATTIAEAVDMAERLQLPGELSQALSMQAMLQFMRGEVVDPAVLERAVSLESQDPEAAVAFRPSVHQALLLAWTGDLDTARKALATIGARCVARGEEGEMMFIAFHLALIDIWRGDLRQAALTAENALTRARQLGGDAALFIALTVRAVVAAYEGRVDDARRDLADAVAAAERSGSVRLMEWTITVQGFLESSLDDHVSALSAVEPLLSMLDLAPDSSEIITASFIPDAAEAMINIGRLDEAEKLVEALEDNGTRLDRAWMLAVGARCRALLSASRGDVAGGVVHARLALSHHDRVAMPFERARTLLVLGRLERRLRQWQSATGALTEALAIFETVGTPLWAAKARSELDRKASGRPRSQGLTPTEQRVAELAAGGMNNKDIAAALFVARKTVEVNLSRIYRKLGVRSRIELYHAMNDAGS